LVYINVKLKQIMLKQESVEGEQKKWQNVKEKEIDQERR
jgi:hypothetical protein